VKTLTELLVFFNHGILTTSICYVFQEAPFVVISMMGTVDKSDHILALTCKYSCYKT